MFLYHWIQCGESSSRVTSFESISSSISPSINFVSKSQTTKLKYYELYMLSSTITQQNCVTKWKTKYVSWQCNSTVKPNGFNQIDKFWSFTTFLKHLARSNTQAQVIPCIFWCSINNIIYKARIVIVVWYLCKSQLVLQFLNFVFFWSYHCLGP